jgi:hypothetical protein
MSNNTYYPQSQSPSSYSQPIPSAPYIVEPIINQPMNTIYQPNQIYQSPVQNNQNMINNVPLAQYYVYPTPIYTYASQQYIQPFTKTSCTVKPIDNHCHKKKHCHDDDQDYCCTII